MVQALIALSGVLFAALLGALVALYNKKRDIIFQKNASDRVKDEWVDRLTQVAENPTLTRTDLLAIRRSLRLFPYDKERVKVDLYESVYKFSRLTNEKELESFKDIESNLYHFVVALFIEIIKEMDEYYSIFSLPIVIEEEKARVLRLIARWELSNRWIAVKEVDGTSNSYKKRISLDLDVLNDLRDEDLDTFKKPVLEKNLIKAVNIEIRYEELRADQKRELKTEFDKFWSTLEKEKNDKAFTGKNPLHSDSYQVAQRIGYILYSALCAVGSFLVIVVIEGSIADQLIDWLKGIGPIINLALIGLSIMIFAYLFKIIITLPEKISKKSLIEICVVSSLFLFLGSLDNKEIASYSKVDTGSTLCLFFSAILLSLAIFVFISQPFGRKLKSWLARTKEKFFK